MTFWPVFRDLCQKISASAKLVPGACLAVLAIEHGCEVITTSRDFGRFPDCAGTRRTSLSPAR
jgi:uncharacterized protein